MTEKMITELSYLLDNVFPDFQKQLIDNPNEKIHGSNHDKLIFYKYFKFINQTLVFLMDYKHEPLSIVSAYNAYDIYTYEDDELTTNRILTKHNYFNMYKRKLKKLLELITD